LDDIAPIQLPQRKKAIDRERARVNFFKMNSERQQGFFFAALGIALLIGSVYYLNPLMTVVGLSSLITGLGLLHRKSWAKLASTITLLLNIAIILSLHKPGDTYQTVAVIAILVAGIWVVWRVWEPDPKDW
jgi:4-hydroxybenzoate polyprenyltransferase